ncbi:WAP four-disulfide core domain protein 18 [Tupaia chinensis]|uniref:WAP four-disulfide core domain protein 18 n=1 Tax=Tupaia chinensis TaxID=246437 RepID=UPI000FFB2078|nr:WAP four-disulfide core domain protein 18 [Tupaia chinensis]
MKKVTVLILVAFVTVGMEVAYAKRPPFRGPERPGVCPEVPEGSFGPCVELCLEDESCPERMKCCSNGCGHVCKRALSKGGSGGHMIDGLDTYKYAW